MKPLGIGFGISNGLPTMGVHTPSRVEDAVWDAVEEAISAGWTPAKFRREVIAAWDHELDEQKKQALKELNAP